MHAAFQRQIPSMIVFEGWAAAGKGGTINVLTERLDPRGVRVVPISPPRTSEHALPLDVALLAEDPGLRPDGHLRHLLVPARARSTGSARP